MLPQVIWKAERLTCQSGLLLSRYTLMCHDSFKQHIYTLPPSWPVCLKNFLQRWNRSDDMRSHANDDEEMCWHWFKIFSDTRSLIPDHNYWSEKCTLSVSFGLSLFKDTTEWSWHWLYVCPKPCVIPAWFGIVPRTSCALYCKHGNLTFCTNERS